MPPCDADSTPGPGAVPSWRRPAAAPAEADPPSALGFAMPAEMASPWLVRNRFRDWLEAWSWPAELIDDIEYAVSEAVSNVAEHAYDGRHAPGDVEVEASVETHPDGSRRLRTTVRDHGRWLPMAPDPAHRGRGLFMMRELMDEVLIRPGESPDSGTEVVLVSPVAPAPGT